MEFIRKFLERMRSGPALSLAPAPVAAPVAPIAPIALAEPLDLQPLEPSFVDNPYPLLAQLRETEPVHRNSSAVWVLTRHADILAALADPRFGNAPSPYAVVNVRNRQRYLCADVANNIIPFLDPPHHDTPRRLIGRAFAKHIRHTPPDMEAIAEEFIAPLRDGNRDEFDLLADFATPYAVAVIGRTLGVPQEDEMSLKEWSHWFFYLFSIIPSHEVREKLDEALAAFRAYFQKRLEAVRAQPDGSLLAGLAELPATDGGLSDGEIVDTCMLLFADGVENVDRAIVNGASQLLRPELWRQLHANPAAIPTAVDECLRFESPALFVGRVAKEAITLHGQTIPQHAGVLLMIGSAHRDASVFPEPDTFKMDRSPNRHMAFGQGKHSCIGGPLVRMEMVVAFRALVRAFPQLRATEDRLEWTPRLGHRWLARLAVAVG
jgi:pimeloyl-[acyl-carrier protein] synthase